VKQKIHLDVLNFISNSGVHGVLVESQFVLQANGGPHRAECVVVDLGQALARNHARKHHGVQASCVHDQRVWVDSFAADHHSKVYHCRNDQNSANRDHSLHDSHAFHHEQPCEYHEMYEMAGCVLTIVARDYQAQPAKKKHQTVGRREKFQHQYFQTRGKHKLLIVLGGHSRESLNAAYIGFKPYIVKT